jgi:hypothetical protein
MRVKCIHELCILLCQNHYYYATLLYLLVLNLLIVAKVHKFLFYTLLRRIYVNMEGNRSLW